MATGGRIDNTGGRIFPVIMCGGSGTRLWPASRESLPKQFIPLFEQNGASTFQSQAQHLSDRDTFERLMILANSDVRFTVAEQLAEVGVAADIVLEPQRRDSAAAVAVAACFAARKVGPEAVVLVAAADHLLGEPRAFVEACRAAMAGARQGFVMTLGIEPTFPATGYGYIRPGEPIEGDPGARRVVRFVEKPNAEAAGRYLAEGCLWNSGNFLFEAGTMIKEFERYAPDVLAAVETALDSATTDLDFVRLDDTSFARAPKISFDYAIMENTERAGVLPVSFPWSDVGNWDAIWVASSRNEGGNALRGKAEVINTHNSLVHSSDGMLTTVVGLDDVVVVAMPDAVLVAARQSSEGVKDLVAQLRLKRHSEVDEHLRMHRPWGWYQRIDLGSRFQVKRIMVQPGRRLSLQKHYHRAEHWVVVRGTAEVTVDGVVKLVHENEAAYLPIGCLHRLANPGKIPLELIEVQVGSYTGEDDIIRIEDVYNR